MYVDDIIITRASIHEVEKLFVTISTKFAVKNLGDLGFFLNVAVTRSPTWLRLSQKQYIDELLKKTNMLTAKSALTPMASAPFLSLAFGTPLKDGFEYRSMVGALQYLLLTQPEHRICGQQGMSVSSCSD